MQFFKKNKFLTILLLILSAYLYHNYFCLIEKNPNIDRNSPTYMNDLYLSDERIYNHYLTPSEQKMYQQIINAKKVIITGTFDSQPINIQRIHDAIVVDHPEFLNYGNFYMSYDTLGNYKIRLQRPIPFSFLAQINVARIERIIYRIKEATKDMDDYEKIKYVYEWIGNNAKYDDTFMYMSKNQSAYNVFIRKNAVCAGFAKASQIIFQNIGIESYGVTGMTTGPHMWNIVKYNGKYYFFDATVATSVSKESSYYYNGLKQSKMENYVMDHPEWYPEIEKTDMK